MKTLWVLVVVLALAATLSATQVSYSNSGGTVSMTSTTVTFSGTTLSAPAGTVSMSCNLTMLTLTADSETWSCTGGTFSLQSTDGTTSVNGTFTSGLFTYAQTEVNRVFYYNYALYANFSASQVISGKTIAVAGAVMETVATLTNPLNPGTGTIQTGLIDTSQQYEPVYIADTGNNRIVETADILGSNWTSIGKLGTGTKQFTSPWGVAIDTAGKIYVSDSGNCRIVRMDNILGTNWTSYGTCGTGTGQFSNPEGIWVDSSGKIYVADTGNNRIVRMDNVTGTNFTSLGTLGNGAGQFSSPAAVTTDSAGNIYVADNANARVVEFSDMLGTNWAAWQFPLNYENPNGVAVDSSGKIYITDAAQSQVFRADNISGVNTVSLSVNFLGYINGVEKPAGIFVDANGLIDIADTNNNRVDQLFGMTYDDQIVLGTVGTGVGNLSSPHAVVTQPESKAIAVSAVSPASLAFPTQLVGTASPSQTTLLSNLGLAPLTVTSVASTLADFPTTNTCPTTLAAGQSCVATVTFQPTTGGLRKGSVKFTLKGAASKSTALSGSGALITLSPATLIMYDGAGGTVTVTNPLTTSTSVKSIKIVGQFKQTNNCTTLAPGASCTINVTWSYTGLVITGVLEVTDSSGTVQYVLMTGE